MNIDEQTIHEKMVKIEIKLIALKDVIQDLCKHMVKDKKYEGKALDMERMIKKLNNMQLQLAYFDEVIKDAKLQRENKPLIIKKEE